MKKYSGNVYFSFIFSQSIKRKRSHHFLYLDQNYEVVVFFDTSDQWCTCRLGEDDLFGTVFDVHEQRLISFIYYLDGSFKLFQFYFISNGFKHWKGLEEIGFKTQAKAKERHKWLPGRDNLIERPTINSKRSIYW